MHATNVAAAYASVSASVLGHRDIEQRVFQQSNGRLMAARNNPDPSTVQLAEAVYTNSRLWTLLAADVVCDHNTLPKDLRAQLASLAIYAQKAGRAVLRKEAKIDVLIDLNSAIIAGLGGESGAQPVARTVQ